MLRSARAAATECMCKQLFGAALRAINVFYSIPGMDTTALNATDPQLIRLSLFHLGIALGIGILIGLERQLSNRDMKHSLGGIRTFALVSIFGFISGRLGVLASSWMPVISLFGLSFFLAVNHFMLSQSGRRGITTEVSLFITFLLGLLVHFNQLLLAVAAALVVSFLMSIKLKIENIVQQVTEDELFAIFKFLVVSVLILPLLPNMPINTFGFHVVNPREVWTVVVLVLSLSFIGYMLIKFWGSTNGIMLTGFLGGFVSSTVVTWIFSKKSRLDEENSRAYALATMLAVSIMFARIGLLSYIINPKVGFPLMLPLVVLLITGLATVTIIKRHFGLGNNGNSSAVALGNPFNLGDAVKFGLIYSIIVLMVSIANARFGSAGVYLVGAISGLANVDAIVISMARLGGTSELQMTIALNAILLAAHSNNIVKLCIAVLQGSRQYRLTMATGIGLMFVSTAVWAAFTGW